MGLLDSSSVTLAIVMGIPLAIGLAIVLTVSARVPTPLAAIAWVVAVGVIAVSAWAIYRAPPPQPPFALPAAPAASSSPVVSVPSATLPAPTCTASGTRLTEAVHNITYEKTCLAAPADRAFTIAFTNSDPGTPHDIHIYAADPAREPSAVTLFQGRLVTGPSTATYHVGVLPPGVYFFHCDVHPARMLGTFVVG